MLGLQSAKWCQRTCAHKTTIPVKLKLKVNTFAKNVDNFLFYENIIIL